MKAIYFLLLCGLALIKADFVNEVENNLFHPVILRGQPIVKQNIFDMMKEFKVNGISITITEPNGRVWSKAYQTSNVTITTNTLFQCASISKAVSSTIAMYLVQKNILNLDEDVNVKLKRWKVPPHRFNTTVTLRRLLSHTAGVTVHGFGGYRRDRPLPTLVQILKGEPPANSAPVFVDVEPGSIERYSGGGTTITQMLMEDVTNKTISQLTQEIIFDKLGMKQSTFESPLPERFHSLVTPGFTSDGEQVEIKWHNYPEQSAASLWSTPSDLMIWLNEIQKSYHGQSNKILQQRTVKEMLKPVKKIGLGPFIYGENENHRFGHGGSNHGYKGDTMFYTNKGVGISVLTNGDFGSFISQALIRSAASVYDWPNWKKDYTIEMDTVTVDPKIFEKMKGDYSVEGFGGEIAHVTVKNDMLYLFNAKFGPKMRLFPSSTVEYFTLLYGAVVKFVENGRGGFDEILIFGRFKARRV